MIKDYRYEILAFLYKNSPQTVDIHPFIKSLVLEGVHSATYLATQMNNMKTSKQIWVEDLVALSIVKNSNYSEDHPINARIEPAGIDEYLRLKTQYEGDAIATQGLAVSRKTLVWTIGIGIVIIVLTLLIARHVI